MIYNLARNWRGIGAQKAPEARIAPIHAGKSSISPAWMNWRTQSGAVGGIGAELAQIGATAVARHAPHLAHLLPPAWSETPP